MAFGPRPTTCPDRPQVGAELVVLRAEVARLRDEVTRLRAELARRTPKPRNGARDRKICRLRAQDPRRWTCRALANRFGTTAEAVRKVLQRGRTST
jgi:hypothetical protein